MTLTIEITPEALSILQARADLHGRSLEDEAAATFKPSHPSPYSIDEVVKFVPGFYTEATPEEYERRRRESLSSLPSGSLRDFFEMLKEHGPVEFGEIEKLPLQERQDIWP